MFKLIVLLVMSLFLIKPASSLICYGTDIVYLETKNRILNVLSDCDEFLNTVKQQYGVSHIDTNSPMRCFKVDVLTPQRNFMIKGCAPKNSCTSLVKPLIQGQADKRNIHVQKMHCFECATHECNK